MKKILITGANGLVGKHLIEYFAQKNLYEIRTLTRRPLKQGNVHSFLWNPEENSLDIASLIDVDWIIHLAGANIGEERWTQKRKKELLNSRILPTKLLFQTLSTLNHSPECILCASAIGFYATDQSTDPKSEDSPAGNDFLSSLTIAWEAEMDSFQTINTRLIKLRLGVVLSANGGILSKLTLPIRYFVGAPIGSGKQQISWIHRIDLCRMIEYLCLDNSLKGIFNAVSSQPLSNSDSTALIAKFLKKPLFLPNIPSWLIYLALGEMADLVTKGNVVLSGKIENTGFRFQFPTFECAMKNLLE